MLQFGDILAELRQDHKMTQKELAKALGVATSSISAYERGTRLPAVDILVELANFFDVTVDYLTGQTKWNVSLSHLSEPFAENISLQRLTKGNIKTTRKWTVNLTENAARQHKRAAFLRDRERRKTYPGAGLK